jgi:hypothetical protein
MKPQDIDIIVFPEAQKNILIDHCLRKLNEDYREDETKEKKAYGLVGGKIIEKSLHINYVKPLRQNWRSHKDYKVYMDKIFNDHAEPSETPLSLRGWMANPSEIKSMINDCIEKGLDLVGTYHMHRVAWEHDLTRELPTTLDSILAKDSELFTFIVSTVNPSKIVIRAFFESIPDKEIKILFE